MMNNLQQWNEENKIWTAYVDNFTVALNNTSIGESGAFSGTTQATPSTGFNSLGLSAEGAGFYKGSFYGPRDDVSDLEIAGSWAVGTRSPVTDDRKTIVGSFGAKQRPISTPASN